MTELLYYKDQYIKDFTATVLEANKKGNVYEIVLDKTAFFPELGGQTSDTGSIGEGNVLRVDEVDGRMIHTVDMELKVGDVISCRVDFDERFEKMQSHTAEHLVCGIIHREYGFENVGFHLADSEVTLDVSGVMTREMIEWVELTANRAIYENVEVRSSFPTAEEAAKLEYRSKLDITENLRIVTIDGYDDCACCAPHVSRTGEIGLIKILDFMKHRGGTRIRLLAGKRAIRDYIKRCEAAAEISSMLCVPQSDIATGVKDYMAATLVAEGKIKAANARIVELEDSLVSPTEKNAVVFAKSITVSDARELVNRMMKKVGGLSVVLIGTDGAYSYIMGSESLDVSSACREANAALCGKGGGRPPMVQGSFSATKEEIEKYFL
ncbi:MAG: alanyl-tRNA editing protein [Clostridia bacterium]|nr:alanyl-tRNA editing protein [Clostridia bacterium]